MSFLEPSSIHFYFNLSKGASPPTFSSISYSTPPSSTPTPTPSNPSLCSTSLFKIAVILSQTHNQLQDSQVSHRHQHQSPHCHYNYQRHPPHLYQLLAQVRHDLRLPHAPKLQAQRTEYVSFSPSQARNISTNPTILVRAKCVRQRSALRWPLLVRAECVRCPWLLA